MSSLRFLGLLSCLSLTIFAGCAAQSDDSAESGEDAVKTASTRTTFNMPATLGAVTAGHATGNALGLWTNVELQFQVACDAKFEAFAYDFVHGADGKTEVLVEAIGSRVDNPGGLHCQSIALQTKKLTVPGILTKDSIKVTNLNGKPAALLPTTTSLEPVGLEIAGVRSLCPEGVVCIQGGTVVRLKTAKPLSCVDPVAPVSYAFERTADNKVKLSAGAIDMVDSRLVRCLSAPKEVEITLPGIIVAEGDIELHSLGATP